MLTTLAPVRYASPARVSPDLMGYGSQEAGKLRTHVFHPLGRLGAQGVNTAMHGGIAVAIKLGFGIHHLIRLLRAGRAVQVGQRQTVYFTGQNREICPYFFDGKTHASPPGRR